VGIHISVLFTFLIQAAYLTWMAVVTFMLWQIWRKVRHLPG
jgi:hypothetical protein